MNILLLTAEHGRTRIALCTTRGTPHCALEGDVVADGGAADVSLREPGGAPLHQARIPLFTLPGAEQTAGVTHLLNWLRTRNIRVDLVAHHIAHHGEHDHILRLAPDRVATLAEFGACKPAVYCVDAVAAAARAMPQVAFFAVRPRADLAIAMAVSAAGLQAPAGCPKKLKVRCESCAN